MSGNSITNILESSIDAMGNNPSTVNAGQLFRSILHHSLPDNICSKPAVDIFNNEDNIMVYIDIQGVNPRDVKIDFHNNKLEISGERKKPEFNCIRNEISYGLLNRKVDIPISVTSKESVKISAENGVLCINIDKKREEQNKFSMSVD